MVARVDHSPGLSHNGVASIVLVVAVILLGFGALMAALAVGFLVRNAALYARVLAAPTSLVNCIAGARSMVRGRVACDAPLASPASSRAAVFYRLVVYDDEGDPRHTEQRGCEFWLTDASGTRARVQAGGTDMFLRRTRYVSATHREPWLRSPRGDQEPTVTIDESPQAVQWGLNVSGAAGPLAVREVLVAPGQEVRLLGRARTGSDGVLAFDRRGLVLCTCDDAELVQMRKEMIHTHLLALAFGLAFAIGGAVMLAFVAWV